VVRQVPVVVETLLTVAVVGKKYFAVEITLHVVQLVGDFSHVLHKVSQAMQLKVAESA
jgi:hypothetical protein